MIIRSTIFAAGLSVLAAVAQAATLTSLAAGGSLTLDDVTFDAFTYEDVGGGFGDVSVSSDDIIVSISSFTSGVSLTFLFNPAVSLSANEAFEIAGTFKGTISSASARTFFSTTLNLGGASITSDSFVEVGQTQEPGGVLLNTVEATPSSGLVLSDTSSLDGTSIFHGWDAQGESGDSADASLSGFSISYTLEGDIMTPVPLPASAFLLLAGLGGLFQLKRRWKS